MAGQADPEGNYRVEDAKIAGGGGGIGAVDQGANQAAASRRTISSVAALVRCRCGRLRSSALEAASLRPEYFKAWPSAQKPPTSPAFLYGLGPWRGASLKSCNLQRAATVDAFAEFAREGLEQRTISRPERYSYDESRSSRSNSMAVEAVSPAPKIPNARGRQIQLMQGPALV